MNFDIGNSVDAAEGYREAICIGEKKMKGTDENVRVIGLKPGLDGTPVQHNTPMKEMISEILEQCHMNLEQLTKKTATKDMKFEDFFKPPQMRSNSTILPEIHKTYIFPHTNSSTMKEDDFHCLLASLYRGVHGGN